MKAVLLSTLFFLLSLTLGAQTEAENLRVFPNPVTTTFEIGHSERVAKVHVINMVGREVKLFDFVNKEKYDVSDLPQGMYLVQLRDKADEVIHTQRIKKQ